MASSSFSLFQNSDSLPSCHTLRLASVDFDPRGPVATVSPFRVEQFLEFCRGNNSFLTPRGTLGTLEKSHHLSDLGFSFVESEGSSLPFSVLRKIQENKSKSPVLYPTWSPCFLMNSCFCSGYCHDSCCCWG